MTIPANFSKGYLMTSGVLAPALIGVLVHRMYHKSMVFKASDILLFAGISIVGGFLSAKMLENSSFNAV